MDPSRRFQEFNMDKNTFPPPPSTKSDNAIADFSRKSNFMMTGQPSHPPTAMLGCGFLSGPNDKLNGLCSNNIVNGNAFNQAEESLNLRYTTENGYWDQNNLAAPWQPSEMSLGEISGNAIYTSSLGQLQSVQWEEPSLSKVSTLLPLLKGHTNQLKAYASSEITEKSHTEGKVQDFPRHGQSGHLNSDFNSLGEIPNLLVENLQSRSLDLRMSSVNVEGLACFQESSNIQAQSGASRGLDSGNISAVVRHLPEVYKENVNDIFVQNQPQISSCSAGSFSTSNSVKGDTEIQTTFSSAASRLIQPEKEKTSAKNVETDPSICGNVLKTKERTSSINTDEIVACKAREKLWNGTLQLSSSVQSSVAAYFRSGDKMPEVYWTDSIEVKGKVRLEAFEKYIQDLPRSRSRGLMVMSLCLKEGSSGDGLKAMYEVIEKYKTGKRVGRAQVSLGVDVYICPNTETIISILATNGFSMGSVSVQDHQDSLIGCAVWRKDSSSEPGSRKLSSQSLLGQPSISSPNSNPKKVNGSDPSSAKTEVEAIRQASITAPVTNGVPGNSSGESKNAESTNDAHTIQSIVKQLTEIEASIFRSLGIEKHQGSLQLLSTILPSSSEVAVKQPEPITEDDDLPEYDFSSAVSHASTASNSLHAAAMEKLANGEFRPKNELAEPSQIRVESQNGVYGGALPQKRKMADSSVQGKPNMTSMLSKGNTGKLLGSKTRNLFDEDDMPEWQPPNMKHFKGSTNLTTRPPPFVPNTFRPPPYSQMPPPQPPGPPEFRPAGRPQHRPYNTNEPANHNRWSRH